MTLLRKRKQFFKAFVLSTAEKRQRWKRFLWTYKKANRMEFRRGDRWSFEGELFSSDNLKRKSTFQVLSKHHSSNPNGWACLEWRWFISAFCMSLQPVRLGLLGVLLSMHPRGRQTRFARHQNPVASKLPWKNSPVCRFVCPPLPYLFCVRPLSTTRMTPYIHTRQKINKNQEWMKLSDKIIFIVIVLLNGQWNISSRGFQKKIYESVRTLFETIRLFCIFAQKKRKKEMIV